jgi:hypothetical protein
MTIAAGTLPLRKPGMRISRPSCVAAVFSSSSTVSGGTSTSTRTLLPSRSLVVVLRAVAMAR